ncbi:MAG: alcohol dehydrogenase catalytic domain-containing protein [Candidatus Brocadiia bacterium]
MLAARFHGDGEIEFMDVPTPEPGEGELLVRVAACGVCGSDHKVLRGGSRFTPGHEVAGTVAETGPGCTTPDGARIAVYLPRHCGECSYCRQGRGNLCPHSKGLLGWNTDGGYAEYMLVPDRNALLLDDAVSFDEGVVLLDTLGTSGHAVRLAEASGAESALVIGAGPIGAGALACMKAFGVETVFVAELSAYRREKAAELGGVPVDPQAEDLEERVREEFPYGVDVVVEAAGTLPTIWQSLDLVRPGGTVCVVGEYWGAVELERPKGRWMLNDITVIRSFYFTLPEFAENQRMVLDGRLPAAEMVTHRFPLTEMAAAFDIFLSGKALKVMVTP